MTYTLNSGIKNTVPLTVFQINQWIENFKEKTVFVTSIGTEYFGLNPELVADFKVHNKLSEHRKDISSIQKIGVEFLKEAYESKVIIIKIDCKCGTVYTTESLIKRTKWNCSKCKEVVFLSSDSLVDTNKGKAYIMTNKNV
ncbi:hypothetical protein [Paenibacillus sp. FSL H3-0286]|uniref:hypothetical protein n=1 Tax=Paenibacillus sp. FSL H3-0286 TaxID=2921427 RepID=UPI00325239F6